MADLEDTLSKLMSALRENKASTGADVWEGKPEQEPLPVNFAATNVANDGERVEIVGVGCAPRGVSVTNDDALDGLMGEYLAAVTAGRKAQREADGGGDPAAEEKAAAPATDASAAAAKEDYDNMDIGELMSKLDDMQIE
jgi:hypothetical protein